ncbi:hypothetical protein HDU67_006988 [Dinochytrium kinnereticum]|nr:hypothetical protein HDU67_006988 [Dinochytrium kinnereticum]
MQEGSALPATIPKQLCFNLKFWTLRKQIKDQAVAAGGSRDDFVKSIRAAFAQQGGMGQLLENFEDAQASPCTDNVKELSGRKNPGIFHVNLNSRQVFKDVHCRGAGSNLSSIEMWMWKAGLVRI